MMRHSFVLELATFFLGAAAATVSTEDSGNINSISRPLIQTAGSILNTPTTSSPIVTTISDSKVQSSTLSSPSSSTSSGSPEDVARLGPSSGTSRLSASDVIRPLSSFTINSTASATPKKPADSCTGCVLQADRPITVSFDKEVPQDQRETATVNATEKATESIIIYSDVNATVLVIGGQTIRTVIEGTTLGTITSSALQFVITPTPGVFLTVDAGPTYVIYSGFQGGLNTKVESTLTELESAIQTCSSNVNSLSSWQPTATRDWSYFIETYVTKPPEPSTEMGFSLPSKLVNFLNQDADVREQFNGSDIATCTVGPIPVESTIAVSTIAVSTTRTFVETKYTTTSVYTTNKGCLRCVATPPVTPTVPTIDVIVPTPRVPNTPVDPQMPVNPQPPNTPGATNKPEDPPKPVDLQQQNQPEPSIIIGGAVLPITTVQPAQNTPRPSGQNQNIPLLVIGSETVTPGQTKTINGVPVFMPTEGPASGIVVGGSTVVLNPNPDPTGPAILTIGSSTITANSQGEFVVDTATLKPGGSQIVVDGQTLSIGSSGVVAVVNGVTSTLASSPGITAAPAIVVAGTRFTATVIDGTTQYVLGAGTTLRPGDVVTVLGSTYSLDAQGTALVINGQTSSISEVPASNSMNTTRSNVRSSPASTSSSSFSSTTSTGGAGGFIASGIGETGRAGGAAGHRVGGIHRWVEGLMVGVAGWFIVLL